MARPQLLLLDEPSLGLAPQITEQIFDILEDVNAEGMTLLLVEQNAAMALDVADRAYVIEHGAIALHGTGAEVAADDQVRRSYLGAG
jgi:branched-chain amino acid transport system ATP-binding protein